MCIKEKNISEGGNTESTITFQQATLWVWKDGGLWGGQILAVGE